VREAIKSLPILKQLRKIKYDRKFENNQYNNLFRGIYDSYKEASRNLPLTKQSGYDNKESASLYKNWMGAARLSDYPVLYWLARIINSDTQRLYDLGGHIGFLYYSYSRYIDFHKNFEWYVYDVPAVLEEGKNIAAQEKKSQLHFTSSHDPIKEADILLASGSLQYIKENLTDIIADKSPNKLHHVIVNMTPMHPDREFFTINSIGTAFCPYKISLKSGFVEKMEKAGWRLVDEWINSEKSCLIPFTDLSENINYYGFYFTKP